MKKIIFFCAFLISVSVVSQSKIKVSKSEIFKDKNTLSELVYSSSDNKGGIILLRQLFSMMGKNSKGYVLEYYDENLKLKEMKDFEDKELVFKGMYIKDNSVNLIEFRKNSKNESLDYNLLTANLDNLNFSSKSIFSINKDDVNNPFLAGIGIFFVSNFSKIDHDPTGEVQISKNEKYIAFNFDIKDKKSETHRVLVYDTNLNKVYEKEFSQNIKDKYFRYNSFTVSDLDGSVYFLGKAYKNDSFRDRKDGVINYNFKLYKLTTDDIKSESFDTNDSYINSLALLSNDKGLFCIGSYSDNNSSRDRGIAFFKIDRDNLKVQKSRLNPFTEQFMIDKYGEKKGKKKSDKDEEISNLVYKEFFITDENEIYFNAEEQYVTTYTYTTTNGNMSTRTIYHFNDIYSCKLNFEGDLQWMRTINKGQGSSGLIDYLSFSSIVKEGKMYIFLNGDEDVKKLKDNRIAFSQTKIKKMNLYVLEIDQTGNFTYDILIEDKDSKVTYKTQYGILSNESGVILFEGNKARDKQIVKIEL
ncbi:hypothetical protein SY27_10990 [Flavobacterium sp. 316]|uniref:hypothetical protein n=1 Tax=Flavobacterium sp. 316 TaxID=1603293 RepID=UPI0005E7936D|nr:hypothetical protein [Flavobacterium sp. 316]KIX21264.1 hypothetical protein SY27_10990 [Flavobacterium sp. 316]